MKQSPIYAAIFNAWKARPGQAVHIDTAEVAKLIRGQLKAKFPATKFSVRISRYSGGSSINVDWIDGPIAAMVEPIARQYSGAGFDGMQDLKYYFGNWLMPDGSASLRESPERWGVEAETLEAAKDGAIPVSFGGCFIFCHREISIEAMRRALASYAARYRGDDLADAIQAGKVGVEAGQWGGWQFFGEPYSYSGVGAGSQYGGDAVLRSWAARRMLAA